MILSIDIGTTTCKAALFDVSGVMSELTKVPLGMVSVAGGAQETEPREWSRALQALCAQLTDKKRIRAVVVSGNGPTVVPVFGVPRVEGTLLHAPAGKARLWLDRRAVTEAREISAYTGHFIDASFVLPQVLHMSRNDPSIYQKSMCFLSSFEYVVYLMTGISHAILHAEDARRWYWTDDLLDHFGLDAKKFPRLLSPGSLVGELSIHASETLGLSQGIPVFSAGPDFLVSILGCAVTEVGMACDRSGTSEGINLCARSPLADDRLMSYLHPVSPFYNISGIISTTGKALRWVQELLGLEHLSFPQLYALAAQAPPGSNNLVFLPYLQGERAPIWNPDARGVFSGLSLSSGRAELVRAVIEGTCMAVRDVIRVMEELDGQVTLLRVTGGPSESPFMNQLKATIVGRPVSVPAVRDAELVGAMVMARTALGDYDSVAQAAQELVSVEETWEPESSLEPLYDEVFDRYRKTYEQLKDTWRSQQ